MVEPGGPARVEPRLGAPARSAARHARRAAPSSSPTRSRSRSSTAGSSGSPRPRRRRPIVGAQAGRSELADSADITQLGAVVQPGEWQPRARRDRDRAAPAGRARRHRRPSSTARSSESAPRSPPQVAGAATRQSAALADGLVAAVDQDNVFAAPADNLRLFEAAAAGLTPARVNQSARAAVRRRADPLHDLADARSKAARARCSPPIATRTRRRSPPPRSQQAQAWPYTSFGTPGTRRRAARAAADDRRDRGALRQRRPADRQADRFRRQPGAGRGALRQRPARASRRPAQSRAGRWPPAFTARRARPDHLRGHAGGADRPRLRRRARRRRGCFPAARRDPARGSRRPDAGARRLRDRSGLAADRLEPAARARRHHPRPARLDPERRVRPRCRRPAPRRRPPLGDADPRGDGGEQHRRRPRGARRPARARRRSR